MSTVNDYIGRKVDLWFFQSTDPDNDTQLQQTIALPGESGRIVTGVQKAAQRVVTELLRERGSTPFHEDEGTELLLEARSGQWQSPADVLGSFARAALRVLNLLQAEEEDDDPDDERVVSIEAVNVSLSPGTVRIDVQILTRDGQDRTYITPLTVSI